LVKRRSQVKPMTRKQLVTVRFPGATSAPHTSTCAWSHTRSEKSCAKGANSPIISTGSEGIRDLRGQSLPSDSNSILKDALPSCYPKMAKVESDTFAFSWGQKKYACRLVTAKR